MKSLVNSGDAEAAYRSFWEFKDVVALLSDEDNGLATAVRSPLPSSLFPRPSSFFPLPSSLFLFPLPSSLRGFGSSFPNSLSFCQA